MMSAKLSHPFIGGLEDAPENRKKDIVKMRNWMNTQPHLPHISDEYILLFLHANYYSHDKTKHTMETYFTLRANTPTIFSNRDPDLPSIQTVASLGYLVRLPKCTPDGYKVLLYSVRDPDPSKLVFSDAIKGFCMYNDCVLSEDGLAEGYVVLFDMKKVQIGHLARVSLPALRAFMVYIQEAHPCRLKAIHVLNTASWIHHIMRIILPLVKNELISMVKFHKGNVPDDEGVPLDMLPEDYGGEAPSMDYLDTETKSLICKYADWLRESVHFRADEGQRVKKPSWWGLFNGSNNNTSNNVKMDEKTFLKNLQID